jgi:hypothetical protein
MLRSNSKNENYEEEYNILNKRNQMYEKYMDNKQLKRIDAMLAKEK